MLPSTHERVTSSTSDCANERIRRQIDANVRYYAAQGPAAIDRRLAELDREWDIERVLETMAPAITIFGALLGLTRGRKWLLLPAVVQTFFLQHALQGWCPPLPVLRGLGVRTADEINEERFALKALRGDFDHVIDGANNEPMTSALRAVRR